MRRTAFISAFAALAALAACGSDTASPETARAASEASLSRDAAQESRIDNPEAVACIRANATEAEWQSMDREDAEAVATLQTVLARPGTIECFRSNVTTIYK